jgi:hypothetical protein
MLTVHRRLLYLSLGDLRLALNDVKGAKQSYSQALEAVLLKGGMVEKQSFWNYFTDSVGDYLSQVLSPNKDWDVLRNNYATTRMNILLSVEKIEASVDDIEFISSAIDPGKDCIIETRTLNEIPDQHVFCSNNVLRSQEGVGEFVTQIE